jgi:microcystin-dependent protein
MPYNVNFTDSAKLPITVNDSTNNTETSLIFPGRNTTGYGQNIAENFLHLLENFASASRPQGPVEGQLYFNTNNKSLEIYDGTNWKAASNIRVDNNEPSLELAEAGELWVDTNNQQLYIFSGERWILVGPNFSTGLRSGPLVEQIVDSTNQNKVIVTFYVEDEPVIIVSKDSFTPKIAITGFTTIKSGVNISSVNDLGVGGFSPKFYGAALNSDSLNVSGSEIPATRFLRSDVLNTTEQGFNIKNNQGLTLGVDSTFSLSVSSGAGKIYNSSAGSSIDIQTNQDNRPVTVLRVIDNKIAINKNVPDEALDVSGNFKLDGSIILTSTTESTNFNNGTFRTAGGIAVSKNVLIGTTLNVTGTATTSNVRPSATDTYNLGQSSELRYNAVYTKNLYAQNLFGILTGNITGNATTATNLKFPTLFKTTGAVTSTVETFTGTEGSITLETSLTSEIISGQTRAPLERFPSDKNDDLLIFRSSASIPGGSTGLFKVSKQEFLQDAVIPIGGVIPFAGDTVPSGYLLCDGREVEISKYRTLYNVIGNAYGTPTIGFETFKLPDLRGRFPLGRDDMDNKDDGVIAGLVQAAPPATGQIAGKVSGPAGRVEGVEAQTVGGTGGSSDQILTVANLPDHEHDMIGSTGEQYYSSRADSAVPTDIGSFSGRGGTTPSQTQYLPTSGSIKTSETLSTAFSTMNPFLTLNFIIRSGPTEF